jgi:succinate dehydrogenase/fumarate reductase flavoprotein subunit
MTDLVVAGAGMAGLAAAAEACRLGASVAVYEKRDRPGGSSVLSSGYVWRHRRFEDFRAECPRGDEALQRLVFDRLDDDLLWLESLGAPVLSRDTGNPLTTGVRIDTEGTIAALARAAGELRLGEPLRQLPEGPPAVLATGGFPAGRDLLAEHVTPEADHVMVRAAPGGEGDGLRLGLAAGGHLSAGIDEIYGRNMPATDVEIAPADWPRMAQRYARLAVVTNSEGSRCPPPRSWAEVDVLQWTARQPRARAWFEIADEHLGQLVRDEAVREMVAAAREAGAPVRDRDGATVVETVAGVTRTLGGLAIDGEGRVADGVHAVGDDAGGIATGGYTSGLASALVTGRVAARAALGVEGADG